MGFASYFNRDLIALNKRLSLKAETTFKEILEQHVIGLEIGSQITSSYEAQICAELLVRLLSRFYPRLKFVAKAPASDYVNKLRLLAQAINGNIEFAADHEIPTFTIVIGKESTGSLQNKLFLGSDGWIAKSSLTKPLSFGQTNNPFGASLTACLAASNIFRFVFANHQSATLDSEIEFSLADFSHLSHSNFRLKPIKLEDVNLVGVGAIGSATVWTLSKLKNLTGQISLIDHDTVEPSNLQRYVLMLETDVKRVKVDIGKETLARPGLSVTSYQMKWDEFVNQCQLGQCASRLVAVCTDSKEQRIQLQSSLPKKIINAYTGESRFGITRHFNFIQETCLGCIYIPASERRGTLEILVKELNMTGHEKLVYEYMKDEKYLDDTFLSIFASKNTLQLESLKDFKGKALGEFYLAVVCGYGIVEIGGARGAENVDVPLSFQSAMAGIILAAEIVFEALGISKRNENVSEWEVLQRLTSDNPYHYKATKNQTKLCICADGDYINVYKEKWPPKRNYISSIFHLFQ